MKIALFGGAFDPPHIGHKTVAESLIKNKVVDQVWFVPVYVHPWAKSLQKESMTSYEHRLKMTQLLSDDQSIFVKEYLDVSFTFNTLEFFKQEYPDNEFTWVMGSEYLSRFSEFLQGHPGLINYTFFIYPRFGFELDSEYKHENMIFLENMTEVKASSTAIRTQLQSSSDLNGQQLSKMLPKQVTDYIKKHNLYFS